MGNENYQHKSLIENMPTAFAHHKAVYDENNQPIDYIFLKVNNKFEELTGLSREDVIDKKATDVLDNITNDSFDWIKFYGEVALTGKSVNFQEYFAPFKKWYQVKVYSNEKGYFTTIFNDINERKMKERELKEKNERLNNIFNNSNDIIFSLSWPDLQIKFVSKSVKDIFGYTAKEFKEDASLLRKITHSEDKYIHKKALQKLKKTGYAEREFRIITKEDNVKWIHDKGKIIYDDKNKPLRIEGIMREVTNRKIAESKLKYSQKLYKTIYESAPLGIIIENEKGDIIEVNEAMSEMSGYDKEELEGFNIIDKFVLPEYEKLAEANIKSIINGENLEYDIKTPTKNGEMKYYHLKETNITFPDDSKGIISMHIDITERKMAKEKIENQKKRMENTIEATGAGTWEWNVQTGETIYNEKWAGIIGYTLEEISPTTFETWKKYTHPKDLEKSEKMLKKHFNGEIDQYKMEIRMRHKEGHWIWVLAQGKVVYWNDDGKPLKMFGIHLNITNRKKRIKELKSQYVFQKKLAEISSKLVGINNDNFDHGINSTLKEIGRFFEVDRSYIFELSDDKKYISNTHEWTSESIKKQKENLQNLSVEKFPWLMNKLYNKEIINVFNIKQLGENAKNERELFQKENIKSIIIVPIFIKDELKGFFGFDLVKEKKNFDQKIMYKIKIITDVIKSALVQYLNINRIEKLTYKDNLTGLYNRRFFEEEMERLDTKRQLPLSVIMADINGLKIINDSYGHETGDQMLIETGKALEKELRDEDILARHGGDEFTILLPQTPNTEAKRIITRLKNENNKVSKVGITISCSLGVATKENEDEDIKEVLKKADDDMYRNKLSESRSTKNKIVQSLLNTLEAKSSETKEHAMRMARLAHNLGEKLALNLSEINNLSLLATLHDIGKSTISEDILTKSGELTDKEWKIIKEHPASGYKIASASEEFIVVAEDILHHHEHWNGNGYPDGLQGKEIPYLARIISIIDAYDVMTNERTYSEAITSKEALDEIKRCAGEQFDPQLVDEFIELIKESEERT